MASDFLLPLTDEETEAQGYRASEATFRHHPRPCFVLAVGAFPSTGASGALAHTPCT